MLSVREAVDEALQNWVATLICLGARSVYRAVLGVDLLVIKLILHARVALVVMLLLVLCARQYKLENKQKNHHSFAAATPVWQTYKWNFRRGHLACC